MSNRLIRCLLCGLRYNCTLHEACPSCVKTPNKTLDEKLEEHIPEIDVKL